MRASRGARSAWLKLACGAALAAPVGEAAWIAAGGLRHVDGPHAAVVFLHLCLGAALLTGALARGARLRPHPGFLSLLFKGPEVLFSVGLVLFLFTYIFATNANMDYVQRFMASGGDIHLAPDSTLERRSAALRYLPLLASDLLLLAWFRHSCRTLCAAALGSRRFFRSWGLPLTLASATAYAFAFPSFVVRQGLPCLAYVCLIPLFLVLRSSPRGWGVFYGVVFGVIQTMITNYWLGTFNLVSLQFAAIVTALEYVPFLWITLLVQGSSGRLAFLVFPAAWTVFDYLRAQGFLGYPWGMLGTSQYAVIPLIQTASLTGVWGLTFLLTLCNAAAAEAIECGIRRTKVRPAVYVTALLLLCAAGGWGAVRVRLGEGALAQGRKVRLALVQQNADPRKDDYRKDFRTLRRLTAQALSGAPDLVVWSETAFVPNIRRWSHEDPEKEPLAALVRDFLSYQKTMGTWLLTGNDDYAFIQGPDGEERLDYNAAVLFSPQGERVETYHKMHLVPFTEYFPFKKQLPAVYALLMRFDVYLWEPGNERVVFRHPLFTFSTPICFEDVFPGDVRAFVRAGAEVILNITNDYWSLTEAEAMQHAVNALFRAVENRRPLIRAAASGLTCAVDVFGRITARVPVYREAVLPVEVRITPAGPTLYTRLGDWFPAAMALLLLAVGLHSLGPRRRGRQG